MDGSEEVIETFNRGDNDNTTQKGGKSIKSNKGENKRPITEKKESILLME